MEPIRPNLMYACFSASPSYCLYSRHHTPTSSQSQVSPAARTWCNGWLQQLIGLLKRPSDRLAAGVQAVWLCVHRCTCVLCGSSARTCDLLSQTGVSQCRREQHLANQRRGMVKFVEDESKATPSLLSGEINRQQQPTLCFQQITRHSPTVSQRVSMLAHTTSTSWPSLPAHRSAS